jgi:hypothetical protein
MIGTNKHNYGIANGFDTQSVTDTILIGKVVSNVDEFDGNRVKVRIKGIDDKLADSELPFAFPLLAKFINIVPSKGESVFIFVLKENNKFDNRMYLGPIISQPHKISYDPHFYSSGSLLNSGLVSPEKAPSTNPDAKGIFPSVKDISVQGRDNTDLLFKPNEIILRVGRHDVNSNLKFNKKTPGYIQLKNNIKLSDKNYGSALNIVGNRINLLSHNGSPRFNLTGQDDTILDSEMEKIFEKAHKMVYGDLLVELMTVLKKSYVTHVHAYTGLPPIQDENLSNVMSYNLTSILSDNIRLN